MAQRRGEGYTSAYDLEFSSRREEHPTTAEYEPTAVATPQMEWWGPTGCKHKQL